jgi:hypothetical protein
VASPARKEEPLGYNNLLTADNEKREEPHPVKCKMKERLETHDNNFEFHIKYC